MDPGLAQYFTQERNADRAAVRVRDADLERAFGHEVMLGAGYRTRKAVSAQFADQLSS